jgi:hypothetical protein
MWVFSNLLEMPVLVGNTSLQFWFDQRVKWTYGLACVVDDLDAN